MKRILALIAVLGLAVAVGTAAAKAPTGKLVIRHELRGCHSWSFNGNASKAAQSIRLTRGASITVIDNDVMPHKLIQKGSPAAKFTGSPAMNHMAAAVKVTFPKAGVYKFTTKAGEDYMEGMKT